MLNFAERLGMGQERGILIFTAITTYGYKSCVLVFIFNHHYFKYIVRVFITSFNDNKQLKMEKVGNNVFRDIFAQKFKRNIFVLSNTFINEISNNRDYYR